jgi:hypothetical protein
MNSQQPSSLEGDTLFRAMEHMLRRYAERVAAGQSSWDVERDTPGPNGTVSRNDAIAAAINRSAVDLYWHIGLLWGVCVSTGALHSPHVDDSDTRHMWTMLRSLLSEAGEAFSWRRR